MDNSPLKPPAQTKQNAGEQTHSFEPVLSKDLTKEEAPSVMEAK